MPLDTPDDDDWTPRLAEDGARSMGITLGEKHWQAIAVARELLARNGRPPSLAEVSASSGMAVAELNSIFPGTAEEILARLSGARELERRETW